MNKLYGNKNRDSFESGEDEMFYLAKNYVMKHFQKIRQTIIHNRFININRQYYDFLRAVPQLVKLDKYQITADEWQAHTEKVKQELIKRQLSMTNTTAYLYLYDLITGKRGNNDIKHVFIDEIQDYTAYQLAYLKTDFPRAHFTMLGDLNQAIFTKENSHSLLNELSTMFDPEKTKVVQLTQSYRSTKQITDFTKGVLVNGEKVTAFNRNGDLPTITVDTENAKMVNDVVNQLHRNAANHMTTAIIGKSLAECTELTDQLKARGEQATLIKTENQRLVEGTLVIPAYLAKGLEFDAIIMWNANDANYHDEDERQLVYTICSRAMHRLDIFAEGKLSRLFANVDPATYKLNYPRHCESRLTALGVVHFWLWIATAEPFVQPREKWREYYEKNIVPLTPEELERIKSLNDRISMKDVQEIYMPLVYYLEMQLNVQRFKQEQTARFLDKPMKNVPFVIGIAGSVAVGKSTTARLLKILLKEAFPGKKVQLITTDGFLYPNAKLKERGIMDRKGFPESYDMEKLITFMDQVKNGEKASAPVYSHQIYDIIPNRYDIVDNPNILIVEGINVLQLPSNQRIYVSDYFDFSIYVDAHEKDIKRWYLERFEMLLDGAFNDPHNYYYSLAQPGKRDEAFAIAKETWRKVNHINLRDYILPTKNRADLIIEKGHDHIINELLLRKY